MDEAMSSALQVAELLIIKRDCDLLKKVVVQLPPVVITQFTPFVALFCYEAIEYFNKKGHPIEINQSSRYSIKDIRQKAKFFNFRLNKLFQCVDNIDYIQNEHFSQLLKFPKLGPLNLHDNLGIYYDDSKNIIGNTHYAFYVFQDERDISKPKNNIHSFELIEEDLYAFAHDMGEIIGGISSGLSTVSDFIVADFDASMISLHSQDYNTNRCTTSESGNYKIIRLFLLHAVSSIGLLLFLLKKAIIRDTGLLLRLEYITYHYTLLRLDALDRYCNQHNTKINDNKLIKLLKSIDYKNKCGLRKPAFRNCMMHFSLTDSTGKHLINPTNLNLAIPYCGLIESQFNTGYEEYKSKLEEQLLSIYEIIKEYLSIDMATE